MDIDTDLYEFGNQPLSDEPFQGRIAAGCCFTTLSLRSACPWPRRTARSEAGSEAGREVDHPWIGDLQVVVWFDWLASAL